MFPFLGPFFTTRAIYVYKPSRSRPGLRYYIGKNEGIIGKRGDTERTFIRVTFEQKGHDRYCEDRQSRGKCRLAATISRDRRPNTTGSLNPHRSRKSWKCQGNVTRGWGGKRQWFSKLGSVPPSSPPIEHPPNVPPPSASVVIRDRDRANFRPIKRLWQNFHVHRVTNATPRSRDPREILFQILRTLPSSKTFPLRGISSSNSRSDFSRFKRIFAFGNRSKPRQIAVSRSFKSLGIYMATGSWSWGDRDTDRYVEAARYYINSRRCFIPTLHPWFSIERNFPSRPNRRKVRGKYSGRSFPGGPREVDFETIPWKLRENNFHRDRAFEGSKPR